MMPPPRDDIDTRVAEGRLEEIDQAVRSGKLVGLLEGRGLNRSTVEELLRPESALRLKAILTDHLYAEQDNGAPVARRNNEEADPGHGPADGLDQVGTVLVYQKREGLGP
jgi:hypothetical protein